jgi:hypothetical protein
MKDYTNKNLKQFKTINDANLTSCIISHEQGNCKQTNVDNKVLFLEEIDKALKDRSQSLCSESIEIESNDQLRKDFENKYGEMSDQEFFECKQNLFGFFVLLDDIAQEQETKKVKANEEIGDSNVDN